MHAKSSQEFSCMLMLGPGHNVPAPMCSLPSHSIWAASCYLLAKHCVTWLSSQQLRRPAAVHDGYVKSCWAEAQRQKQLSKITARTVPPAMMALSRLAVFRVCMQLQYDSAPVHIGTLDSSVWVFALLGAFYAVLGALFVILDGLVERGVALQGESFPARMASGAA